jgi:DNA polymerase-3 subunit delta
MSKTAPTFYVFHGEDEIARKAQIRRMMNDMADPTGLNIAQFEGSTATVRQILETASTFPFMAERRLVIVNGLLEQLAKNIKGNKEQVQYLLENLPNLPPFARLVLNENKELEKNEVVQLARQHPSGFERKFAAPDPGDLAQWLRKRTQTEYGLELQGDAAQALADVLPVDTRAADNELYKLGAYVNFARPITRADVELLTAYKRETDSFALVDALAERDGKRTMAIVTRLLEQGEEIIPLLGMVNRQFRYLILAREHQDNRQDGQTLAEALGLRPHQAWLAKKYAQQARRFDSLALLEDIYRKLLELDYRIKTGQMSDRLALDLFIAGVTH